jgi:hypothetical protein
MASFKLRQEKKRLPNIEANYPEGYPLGTASLYDAFVESSWKRSLDEYDRRGIGHNLAGEKFIPYPSKEEWWDDPSSRLPLLREFNKYLPEEELEKERLLKEETDAMEKAFFELLLSRPTPKRQWLWDAKRKSKRERRGGERSPRA